MDNLKDSRKLFFDDLVLQHTEKSESQNDNETYTNNKVFLC
jgi:hypothetical protein